MKILHVKPGVIDQAWLYAAPWIQKAGERGNGHYPLDDYQYDITMGKKHLVKFVEGEKFAWVLAGVVENSEFRTCVLYSIGGKGALEMLPDIDRACEDFAKCNGCKYLTFSGRKGWEREVKKIGWKPMSVTYGREV